MEIQTRAGMHRSQLFFGLLALLALLLAGCGSNNGSANQLDPNQVFIWPLTHVPNFTALVLDPANTEDLYSASVVDAIYGGLVTTDHNLNVVPDMATWEISPDGRTYTFHLKPNLHFSDGSPLTAQDFAYSIDRALSPNSVGPASVYLNQISGAKERYAGTLRSVIGTGLLVPDAQTLVIKLVKPVAYFLEALTYPTSFPVEKTLVQKYGDDYKDHTDWTTHLNEGGDSGPFMIKTYDKDQLVLVPNPYWYGAKITLKEIDRPYVANPVDAYTSYRQGKYDYSEVPSQEYQAARDQADFHEIGLLQTDYVGINQDSPPFDSLAVRQAFALAVNKQLLADRVLNGAAYPTNHIVPQGMPGFDDSLNAPGINSRTVTGDVDTAQKLITGYFSTCNCKTLQVKLTYSIESTDEVHTAEALMSMWNTVLSGKWGTVEVTQDKSTTTFYDLFANRVPETIGNQTGAMQMWLLGWSADYPDPQDWLSLLFNQVSIYNASNYHDSTQGGQKFDAWQLMAQADVEQNSTKRMNLYNQIEQQLVDNVAWIPYTQPKGIWRIKTYIQGFNPSSLDLLSDQDWANVVVLAH